MRKFKVICVVVCFVAIIAAFISWSDESVAYTASVTGIAKNLSTEEEKVFMYAFDDETIVQTITSDGKAQKALMLTSELAKKKKFPFTTKMIVYPDGFASIY